MELKKSPKADLQSKRSIYMLVGIVVSLGLVITLFSWSVPEKKIEVVAVETDKADMEMTEITVQEDQKQEIEIPKAPIQASDLLNVVSNDAKIEAELTFVDDDLLKSGDFEVKTFGGGGGEGLVVDDTPVLVADEMPTFQGKTGDAAKQEFINWVQKGLEYPQELQQSGVQGTVYIEFVIERNGSISNAKVVRGVDKELDNLALARIKSAPKWVPGKNRGVPVRMRYQMPVTFQLQ